ncbi:MAG: phage tail tape measure protein [Oscillospiraceae bacterium]
MASKSKTYELALKIAGKVDSSLKKSCLAAAKDVNTLSASVQKVSGKAAKAMATATSAAITAITVDAAKKAIEFEGTMADVAKVVDGLRDENGAFTKSYYEMSDALLNMSKSIPMTADALGQIMASAGQAGIASEDLTAFTETAAKMGVAFDTTAEQAGEWMATWRTALNLSQTQVTALGDQLNYLGNTTSENALKLSEVVTRVGALGQTAGLSAGEVAALAASMPGVTAEISATGIKSMMIAMTAGASATSKQAAVLQQLGFTASDMANRMQTDAKGAIIDLLGAIKQLPAAEQTAALSQYFGKESVSSIAPLLKNLGYLQQQFAKVGDATAYSGSMEAEYAVRADTTANKLQLMQNKLAVLQVQIGNKILPYVNDALDDLSANALPKAEKTLGFIIPKVAKLLGFMLEHSSALINIGLGITAVVGISKTFKAVSTAYKGATAAVKLLRAAQLKTKTATIALTAQTRAHTFAMRASAAASKAAAVASKAFRAGLAFVTSPIGIAILAITALIAAGVWLYKNWDTVKAKAAQLGAKISGIWTKINTAVTTAIAAISSRFPALGAVLSGLWKSVQDVWGNIKAIFSNIIGFIDNVFSGNWSAAWGNVVSIFGNLFGELANIAKAPINAVISVINMVLSKINEMKISIPDWVPGVGGKTLGFNIPQIPMLATGGIATAPTLAMVGEGGEPEAVLPLSKLAQLLDDWDKKPKPGSAGGGESIVFSPVFNFYGGTPSREEAMEAGRVSFAEFKRLYRRMKDEERRKQFSPA